MKNQYNSIIALWAFLLMLPLQALAQDQALVDDYQYRISRNFSKYDDKAAVVKEILEMAKEIASYKNVEVKEITFSGHLALEILPGTSSVVNKEAQRLKNNYGGLKLILSPYHRKLGSNAFFTPDGQVIGGPAEMVLDQLGESYFHELGHATTYLRIIQKSDETYAGFFKLLKGTYLSQDNQNNYFRFASMDEAFTTLFSAKMGAEELYRNFKKTSYQSFLKIEANEDLLSEINFSLENAEGLLKQLIDLNNRATVQLQKNNYKVQATTLKLGTGLAQKVFEFTVLVDSWDRAMKPAGGGSYMQAFPEGAELHYYSLSDNKEALIKRLTMVSEKARAELTNAQKASDAIYIMIEYPDLAKTDVSKLYLETSKIDVPFAVNMTK